MERSLQDLMDAYDDAHTLRKQLSHQFFESWDNAKQKGHEPTLKALGVAMEAEETARLELVNMENKIAAEGAK